MTRAIWFVLGLLVHRLLHERDDFDERLADLEREADEREYPPRG